MSHIILPPSSHHDGAKQGIESTSEELTKVCSSRPASEQRVLASWHAKVENELLKAMSDLSVKTGDSAPPAEEKVDIGVIPSSDYDLIKSIRTYRSWWARSTRTIQRISRHIKDALTGEKAKSTGHGRQTTDARSMVEGLARELSARHVSESKDERLYSRIRFEVPTPWSTPSKRGIPTVVLLYRKQELSPYSTPDKDYTTPSCLESDSGIGITKAFVSQPGVNITFINGRVQYEITKRGFAKVR